MYNKLKMNRPIQNLRTFTRKHWLLLVGFGGLTLAVFAVLLLRLQTLMPGYTTSELNTYHTASSLNELWKKPIDAPYYLLVHGLQYLTPHNLLAVRLVSVLIGAVSVLIFCILMIRWHGVRTALVGTMLFAFSAWFLHIARYGSPQAMYLVFLPLAACGMWLREKQAGTAVVLGLTLSALLLYTPGMAWFLVFGLFLQWPIIDKAFKKNPGAVVLGSVFFLAILAPLGWYFYKHTGELTSWLCLPRRFWAHSSELLRDIVNVPLAIFFRMPSDNPVMQVGRLPVLNVFSGVMFAAGCYVYAKNVRLARSRLFLAIGVLGSIIIGISQGAIPITPLVPFAFAVATAGIGYMIDVWYQVFPRNPLAQGLGMGLLALVILLVATFQLSSYFVAWPHATASRSQFTIKGP